MLKMRVLALAFTIGLMVTAPTAWANIGADGCDEDIWKEMQKKSNEGFLTLAGDGDQNPGIVGNIMKPPTSIMEDGCARDNFDIWNMKNASQIGTLSTSSAGWGGFDAKVTNFFKGGNFDLQDLLGGFLTDMFSSTVEDQSVCKGLWNNGIPQANSGIDFKNFGIDGVFSGNDIGFTSGKSFDNLDSILKLF